MLNFAYLTTYWAIQIKQQRNVQWKHAYQNIYVPVIVDLEKDDFLILGTCQKLTGGEGGGNFKFGFGNEETHSCNGGEIC